MPATIPLLQEGRYSVEQELPYLENCSLFQAYDTENDSQVTIVEVPVRLPKVATAAQREALHASFVEQAEKLTGFKHKSIPGVLGYFSEAGRNYLVTDPLDGVDLASVLAEQKAPFSVAEVTGWADTLLDALNGLHTFRPAMVYRNISPINIMLRVDRSVELVPAGMVVCGEKNGGGNQASTGNPLAFSPLEQIWSGLDAASQKVIISKYDEASEKILKQELDARSDIYSLGATLYCLLTGTVPVDALERSIEMIEGNTDPLRSPHKIDPSIPLEVSDVIMKAMEIRREYRFDSAAIMRQVLRTALVRVKEREGQEGLEQKIATSDVPTVPTAPTDVIVPEDEKPANDPVDMLQKLREAEEKMLDAERRAAEAEKKLRETETQTARLTESFNLNETEDDLLGLLAPHTSDSPQSQSDVIVGQHGNAPKAFEDFPTATDDLAAEIDRKRSEPEFASAADQISTDSNDVPVVENEPDEDEWLEGTSPAFDPAVSRTPVAAVEAAVPAPSSELASLNTNEERQGASSFNIPAMAAAAVVLLLAAVGAWFYLGSRPASQPPTNVETTISSEPAQPTSQVGNQSQQNQTEAPAPSVPSISEEPTSAEQTLQVQAQKTASVTTPQKTKKPASTPTKAPTQKKAVTVDDLINDN